MLKVPAPPSALDAGDATPRGRSASTATSGRKGHRPWMALALTRWRGRWPPPVAPPARPCSARGSACSWLATGSMRGRRLQAGGSGATGTTTAARAESARVIASARTLHRLQRPVQEPQHQREPLRRVRHRLRPGETCCSGACADLDDDHDHCGSCGHVCGESELCIIGLCQPCPADGVFCGECCTPPLRECCG